MSNEIQIPQILREQRNYSLKILQNSERLFGHIDFLRRLVIDVHQVYNKLCKKVLNISQICQRKLNNNKNSSSNYILTFLRSISSLHLQISNQLSSNNVALGTKSHKIIKNRLQILKEKLHNNHNFTQDYLQKIENYNIKIKKFDQKCEYFNNYEKDVFKYYSLKANTQLYEKLSQKELFLKQKQEEFYQMKSDYKIAISELKTSIKEYFEMQKSIINDYKKLLINIRKNSLNSKIFNEPIIEQDSNEAKSSHQRDFDIAITKRTGGVSIKDRSIALFRRQKIKQIQRQLQVQKYLEEYMQEFIDIIIQAGKQIDQIRTTKEYERFNLQKLIMLEILPQESIKDIDLIISQIALFRSIILNITIAFGKNKLLQELKKYRGFNFDKFIEDTNHFIQQEKTSLTFQLVEEYKIIEQKFEQSHHQYMTRFREKVLQIEKDILYEYSREDKIYEDLKNKKNISFSLFEKKYYQIMMLPFFINLKNETFFKQNKYLTKFSSLLNANQVQKMMTLQGFQLANRPMVKMKTTCCGLMKKEVVSTYVDEFNCALKDGLILIQGKLKLYENYFSFKSSFNSKTIFGSSDLRVPKWDIIQFVKDKHLISLLLIVVTTHGNLQFTSFLSNPMQSLLKLYDNRKSVVSVMDKKDQGTVSELQTLEQRFQSDLQIELKKSGIIIDKLSTYLTEDQNNLSISTEYHQNGTNDTSYFEIKIFQLEESIQYLFIHDQNYNSVQIKKILEDVSKQLIHRRADQRIRHSYHKIEDQSIEFDYSIIEPMEKNKISFLKEPSFINRKSESFILNQKAFEENRNSVGQKFDLNNLLSSRNNFSSNQTHPIFQEQLEVKSIQLKANKQNTILKTLKKDKSKHITQGLSLSKTKTDIGAKSNRNKTCEKSKIKPKGFEQYKSIIYVLAIVLVCNFAIRLALQK